MRACVRACAPPADPLVSLPTPPVYACIYNHVGIRLCSFRVCVCVRACVCIEYILLSEEILLLSNRNLFCD